MERPINSVASSRTLIIQRYLLGLFILIQLSFIIIANIGSVALFFKAESPLAALTWTAAGAVSEPWAHWTAQEQYWRMFAPSVPPRATFLRLRLHFDDEKVLVPSEFEAFPEQPILHLPGSGERIWHVEKSLAAPFLVYDADDVVPRLEEWRAYLRKAIGDERQRYLAYMASRARRYLEAVGDKRVPDQIDLLVSLHTISKHDRYSAPEFELLALRWRPANAALQLCTDTPLGVDCDSFDK